MNPFYDLFYLFFPRVCGACGNVLFKHEDALCLQCIHNLPKTNHLQEPENYLVKLFWGRFPIHAAAAYYTFSKGSKVQNMLHELKYKGNNEVGIKAGSLMGKDLNKTEQYQNIDFIIPVPLHPKKFKKRGYNQSEEIAKGLAKSMNVPLDTKLLTRGVFTETQTKKSRFNRWQNVEDVFVVNNYEALVGKHVLLVDDVITTGATIEACAQKLIAAGVQKISVVSIACA